MNGKLANIKHRLPELSFLRKIKTPPVVFLCAIGLIAVPLFIVLQKLSRLNWQITDFSRDYNIAEFILLAAAPLVGICLFYLRKWSWFLFQILAAALILYNIYYMIRGFNLYHWMILKNNSDLVVIYFLFLMILALILAIIYFLRKDIALPYFSVNPRGFRTSKRKKTEKQIYVGALAIPVGDISEKGMLLLWQNCGQKVGDIIQMRFQIENTEFILPGKIVRLSGEQVGVFLNAPLTFQVPLF